jgi:hypothetical protein
MAMETKLMPRDLKLVALLFIIFGILSAIDTAIGTLVSLLNGHLRFEFNFGILQIPIGFGLLNLKQRWHSWAIIYLKVAIGLFILGLFIFCIAFVLDRPFNLEIFEQSVQISRSKVGEASREMVTSLIVGAIITLWIIITLWMYRELTKPSTRELFNREPFGADSGLASLNLRDE